MLQLPDRTNNFDVKDRNQSSYIFQAPLLQLPDRTNIFDVKDRNQAGLPIREKRYAHLDSALSARQLREKSNRGRGDSVNSRYSSDPVQILEDNGMFGKSSQWCNATI